MTPTERYAAMQAMPTHVVYMTQGAAKIRLITQSFCEIIEETRDDLTINTVGDVRTIPRSEVYAVKHGRLTPAEMDAVFAEHGHKQVR